MKLRALLLGATAETRIDAFMRQSDRKWIAERARHVMNYALSIGVVARAPVCAWCGSAETTQGHHHDYNFPLAVTWLCRKCHSAEHARLRHAGIALPGQYAPWHERYRGEAA